jgi:hypothetical protein
VLSLIVNNSQMLIQCIFAHEIGLQSVAETSRAVFLQQLNTNFNEDLPVSHSTCTPPRVQISSGIINYI